MNLNPICHPSPAKKMKCSFLDYIQLLMIGQAGWWTQTPSATPLQSKNEILIFGLCSTSDDGQAGQWTQTPSATPLQPINMKCSYLSLTFNMMISQTGQWTKTPSASPLQPIKWNAHFWIMFNFWWLAGLVNGLKPHPPPLSSQKMKCSFWIMFNFWWSARLVNGLKPHPPPLSSQKNENEMLHFWIMFTEILWWSDAGLVNGLKPHLPALSSQKNEMLLFGLRSTSDDWLG